jgi:hypothetical protein
MYALSTAWVPALNWLRFGRWDGADDVPIGALRLADSPDGKHNYFDLLYYIGVRSGLKVTGVDALMNAWHKGQTGPEMAKQAAGDIARQVISPLEGPAVRFGEKLIGRQEFAPQAAKDESQLWLNIKTAIKEANPIGQVLMGGSKGAQTLVGPYAPQQTAGRTTMEQWVSKRLAEQTPKGQQTREEMDQGDLERSARDAFRRGDTSVLDSAVQQQKITPTKARELAKEASTPQSTEDVTRLTDIGDKLHAWTIANPSERQAIRGEMIRAIKAYARDHTPAQVNSLAAQYRKAGVLQ